MGGLAVISHGLERLTYDGDIWLDPARSVTLWSDAVHTLLGKHAGLRLVRIGSWQEVSPNILPEIIESDGVIRLMGASQPLDIFRKPNELEIETFEEVWERATVLSDGSRLPDVIDLLVTKQATGRDKDRYDIDFLEGVAQKTYLGRLPHADAASALEMLDRYLTPRIAKAALQHPSSLVREAGQRFLTELAEDGDPFAAEILRKLGQ